MPKKTRQTAQQPGRERGRTGSGGRRLRAALADRRVHLVTVMAAGILTYGRMLDNEFFYDDYRWVWSAHTLFNLKTVFTTSLYGFYRPVVCIAFWLNERLFGLDPFSYNLVNLLLHLADAALVYVLVDRLTRERLLAWLTALLFVGGFENYGAIVWISGRTTLIGFFFFLLGLLASLAFFRTGRLRYYPALFACFTLSIFAKETAFSFLVFLPLFYLLIPGRRPFTRLQWVLFYAPLGLAVAFNLYSRIPFAGQASIFGAKLQYVFPNFVAAIVKPAIHPYLQRGSAWPRMLAFVVFAALLYRGRRALRLEGSVLGETRLMLFALLAGVVSALPTVLLAYNFFDLLSIQQTRYHYFPSLGGALAYALIFSRWVRTGFAPGSGPGSGGGARAWLFGALVILSITLAWEYAHFVLQLVRYATGAYLFDSPVRLILRSAFLVLLVAVLYRGLILSPAGTRAPWFRRMGGVFFALLLASRILQGFHVEAKHDRNARVHKYVISVLWEAEDLDARSEVYVQQEFMGPAEYGAGVAMEGYPWRVYPVKTLPSQIRVREEGRRYFYCVIDEKGARLTEYPPLE